MSGKLLINGLFTNSLEWQVSKQLDSTKMTWL